MIGWSAGGSRSRARIAAARRRSAHGGAYFGGWNTNLCVIPSLGIAIVLMMNIMLDKPAYVWTPVINAILGLRTEPLPHVDPDPQVLASAPGVYEATPGTLTNFRTTRSIGRIQIAADGARLVLHARRGDWKRGIEMVQDGGDPLYFALDHDGLRDNVVLTRDASGRVDGLLCDDLVRMHRTETVAPWV